MGVLYLDKRSPHFDMTDDFLFEMIKVQKVWLSLWNEHFEIVARFDMIDDSHFEMRAKPLKHFEMIYDCRFEMTGAKIFVNKKLRYTKHCNQHFGTENFPYILLYENLI